MFMGCFAMLGQPNLLIVTVTPNILYAFEPGQGMLGVDVRLCLPGAWTRFWSIGQALEHGRGLR